MRDTLRVAAVQMSSGGDKEQNIVDALALIERAAQAGAALVVLPETWTYMGDSGGTRDAGEPIPGDTTQRLADAARRHHLWLHAGSIFEVAPGEPRVFNTTVVFDPEGNIAGQYRKIHLFDVSIGDNVLSQESASVAPGDEVVVVDMGGVKLGLTICYDLRFPELYRLLALEGAEIISVPAAFHNHTGKDHWEILVCARAIENQVFMVAPNAFGKHIGGWHSYGRSMIVDPWGTPLATAADGVGITIAECDLNALDRIRRDLPSLANRQPNAYRWNESAALVS